MEFTQNYLFNFYEFFSTHFCFFCFAGDISSLANVLTHKAQDQIQISVEKKTQAQTDDFLCFAVAAAPLLLLLTTKDNDGPMKIFSIFSFIARVRWRVSGNDLQTHLRFLSIDLIRVYARARACTHTIFSVNEKS